MDLTVYTIMTVTSKESNIDVVGKKINKAWQSLQQWPIMLRQSNHVKTANHVQTVSSIMLKTMPAQLGNSGLKIIWVSQS